MSNSTTGSKPVKVARASAMMLRGTPAASAASRSPGEVGLLALDRGQQQSELADLRSLVDGIVQLGDDVSMTTESGPPDRQQRWTFVLRRSFGISDVVTTHDAREALVRSLQDQLQENGWQSPSRGTAEPIVDALMALGASEDLEDFLLSTDAANRLIEWGLAEIDPEHLVFDMRFEYPPEVVGAAQQVLDRIALYVREQPLGD